MKNIMCILISMLCISCTATQLYRIIAPDDEQNYLGFKIEYKIKNENKKIINRYAYNELVYLIANKSGTTYIDIHEKNKIIFGLYNKMLDFLKKYNIELSEDSIFSLYDYIKLRNDIASEEDIVKYYKICVEGDLYKSYSNEFYTCITSKIKEEEIEKRRKYEEKLEQEEKARIKKIEAKYKMPYCPDSYIDGLYRGEKGCIFELGGILFKVLQQINDGTLITPYSYDDYFNPIVLIMKNKSDGQLVDESIINKGLFTTVGNYKYVTIIGQNKTILKIKRLQ